MMNHQSDANTDSLFIWMIFKRLNQLISKTANAIQCEIQKIKFNIKVDSANGYVWNLIYFGSETAYNPSSVADSGMLVK